MKKTLLFIMLLVCFHLIGCDMSENKVYFSTPTLLPTEENTECKEHDYNSWRLKKPATCGEYGEDHRVCSICGKEETRLVEKKDRHVYSANYECKNCGKKVDSGHVYTLAENGREYIFHYNGNDEKVVVLDEFNNLPVTQIADHAFSGNSKVKEIILPECITTIGKYAFSGCTNLKNINAPESLKTIEEYAFFRCVSLTSFTIPEAVVGIPNAAFKECVNLTPDIHDKVLRIGNEAFKGCKKLTSIVIPKSVQYIGEHAFSYCDIENLTFEEDPSLDRILKFAFAGNKIEELTIPEGVILIDDWAFKSNTIKKLTLPKSLESISSSAFSVEQDIESVIFGGSEAYWNKLTKFKVMTSLTEAEYIYREESPPIEPVDKNKFIKESDPRLESALAPPIEEMEADKDYNVIVYPNGKVELRFHEQEENRLWLKCPYDTDDTKYWRTQGYVWLHPAAKKELVFDSSWMDEDGELERYMSSYEWLFKYSNLMLVFESVEDMMYRFNNGYLTQYQKACLATYEGILCEEGTDFIVPDPPKEGYKYIGWNGGNDFIYFY